MNGVDKTFCCIPCGYFCNRKSSLTKHHATKGHINKIQYFDVVVEGKCECKNCVNGYSPVCPLGWTEG